MWWLLGGGVVAIAAAVVAVVVFAVISPGDKPGAADGLDLAPADAHSIGAADAPVTIVVFSSFTCPACAMFALGTEQQLIADYVASGKARLVHRVIAWGGESELAAEAAECAGAQGGFQEYYWVLFSNGVNPNPLVFTTENLKQLASTVGLDADELGACLESREHALHIRHEREAAGPLGVEYTPTVFINGEAIVGLASYDLYRELIERELAKAE